MSLPVDWVVCLQSECPLLAEQCLADGEGRTGGVTPGVQGASPTAAVGGLGGTTEVPVRDLEQGSVTPCSVHEWTDRPALSVTCGCWCNPRGGS